ncbi:MAG: hypothetical protein ACOC9P_01735 [bacterium]
MTFKTACVVLAFALCPLVAAPALAQAVSARAEWLAAKSDQELWDLVPPATQKRSTNVAFETGCPEHGRAIYRKGRRPWIMSRDQPFKVTCPVGGEVYPSNDYEPWGENDVDPTQPYVDDGNGYVAEDGTRYYFVANYIFWQRWRDDVLDGLGALRRAYRDTGDQRYAHKAAVLLARLAEMYPATDFRTQAVHKGRDPSGVNGGILHRVWENLDVVTTSVTTFEVIGSIYDENAELRSFLADKGITAPRHYIQERLFLEMLDRITGGRDETHPIQIQGNFGYYQRSAAELASVLSNDDPQRGWTRDQVIQWIRFGGGQLETGLWNRIYRDGHGGESSPGYSALWIHRFATIAEHLRESGYELFDHPKMRQAAHALLDMAVLGKFTPNIGDTGGLTHSLRIGWFPHLLHQAFEASGEPRFAKALAMIGEAEDEAIREAAQAFGAWPHRTRHLGGYGLAIAESPGHEVGLSLYYGYAEGGHGHFDRLNIELFALGRSMLPEQGYPSPLGLPGRHNKRMVWTSGNISHYSVVVNRKRHRTREAGRLLTLVGSPVAQVVDAEASEVTYPDAAEVYRRTSLLVETETSPVLIDLFRVRGGWEHAWSFHGPAMEEFEPFGVSFSAAQPTGTLAGAEVSFGDQPTDEHTHITSGFQYLTNVHRAAAPDEPWGATWREGEEALRMTFLPEEDDREIVFADGEPEMKPEHPETLPYLLAFRGEPGGEQELASTFAAVVEPFRGSATVAHAERLEASGAGMPAALRLHTREDESITVLSNRDVDGELVAGEMRLDGQLALLRLRDGEAEAALLINVRELNAAGWTVESAGPLRGRVAGVDYERNTITLDRRLAHAQACVGQVVTLGNDRHHTTYEIEKVTQAEGGTVLHFGRTPMLVGTFEISEVEEGGRRLVLETEFIQWRVQVDGGAHGGRRLLHADYSGETMIASRDQDSFVLAEADGTWEAGETAWIGDVGPGDQWRIPSVTVIERDGEQWRVRTNQAARVTYKGEHLNE